MYATVHLTTDPTAMPVPDDTEGFNYMTHVRYVVTGLESESVLYGDAPLSHFYTKEKEVISADLAVICHWHVAGMLKLPIARTMEGEEILNLLRTNVRRDIHMVGEEPSQRQQEYRIIPTSIKVARVKKSAQKSMLYCNDRLAEVLHAKMWWGCHDGIIFQVDLRAVLEDMMVDMGIDMDMYSHMTDNDSFVSSQIDQIDSGIDALHLGPTRYGDDVDPDEIRHKLVDPHDDDRVRSSRREPQYDAVDIRDQRMMNEQDHFIQSDKTYNSDKRESRRGSNNNSESVNQLNTSNQSNARGALRSSEITLINGRDPDAPESRRGSNGHGRINQLDGSKHSDAQQGRRRSGGYNVDKSLNDSKHSGVVRQDRRGSNDHDDIKNNPNASNHSNARQNRRGSQDRDDANQLNGSGHSNSQQSRRRSNEYNASKGINNSNHSGTSRQSRRGSNDRDGNKNLNASDHSTGRSLDRSHHTGVQQNRRRSNPNARPSRRRPVEKSDAHRLNQSHQPDRRLKDQDIVIQFDASNVEDVQQSRKKFDDNNRLNRSRHLDSQPGRRQPSGHGGRTESIGANHYQGARQSRRISTGNGDNRLDASHHSDTKQNRRKSIKNRSDPSLGDTRHAKNPQKSRMGSGRDVSPSPIRSDPSLYSSRPNGSQKEMMEGKNSERSFFSTGSGTNSNCLVCFEHKKIFAFVPCGHLCLCERCARNPPYGYQSKDRLHATATYVCPVCRMDGASMMRVYF